jgi:serine/threonine protein phosphatase PrpC
MLEQFQVIYTTQRWVKYTTCLGVLGGCAFLLWFSGGFPPRAWRFLLQTLFLLPRLWVLKGPLMLLPLSALLLLSLTILFFWLVLTTTIIWIVKEHWHYLRELQSFDDSLLKAQNQTANDVRPWWQEQTEPLPQVARKWERQTPFSADSSAPPAPPVSPIFPISPVATLDPPIAMQNDAPSGIISPREQMLMDTTYAGKPSAERPIKLVIGTGLDPGIKRKDKPNEDRLLAIQGTLASDMRAQPFGLFVVADGIGGHANGQEASRLAIQMIRDVVIPALLGDVKIDEEQAAELLRDAVQEANRAVCEYNQMYRSDIGTTVTAALLVGKSISIANVGDSRTYVHSKHKGLTKITRDHSVVARLVENGSIAAEDVYSHPRRNEIYRSLGHKVALDVDMYRLPLERDTTLMLCSDGLWEMVRDPYIQEILNMTLPHSTKASKALVQAALEGGGQDNISVIVVCIM